MDGKALILCEGAFGTADGKTAHGLVRHTLRYQIVGVLDSHLAGRDAGEALGGRPNQIPIFRSLSEALERATAASPHIVSLGRPGKDIEGAENALRQANIVCSSRGGRIRVSLAPYNDETDIESLVVALR